MTRLRLWESISLSVVVLAVVCFVSVAPIQATPINPPAPGTQTPDFFADCTGCTMLASFTQTELDSHQNWQATMHTAVFMDPGNSFGGGLDFFYQIQNLLPCTGCTSSVIDNIGRFTAISFLPSQIPGGLLVDIGINVGSVPGFNNAGTATPGTVDRVPPGDTIGWSFASSAPLAVPLTPGSTSIILEIQTNATNFGPGFAEAIDGGTADFNAFQPAGPAQTPEPASMLLLGSGLLGLAPLVRRRFLR